MVNCTSYIFGVLSDGYSQYPIDGTSNLFRSISFKCEAPTQLVIHRDESIMHYVYVRKIDSRKYIGLAVSINGYYISKISSLFNLFEIQIEQIAERGVILNYSTTGDLTTTLDSLINEEAETISCVRFLQHEISSVKAYKLGTVDYTVSNNSIKIFCENDDNSEIVKASYTYGFTIILKQENYDTVRSNSFRSILKKLSVQNETLQREIEDLKETNKQILRQKRQFKKVIFLFITLILCGVGIYFLYENLNNTQDKLEKANITLQEKNTVINSKNESISFLEDSISNLKKTLQNTRKDLSDLSDTLQYLFSNHPFIVTESEACREGFEFKYYCLQEQDIAITLSAVNTRGSQVVSTTYTLSYKKGEGEQILKYDRLLNPIYSYYVVLIHDGQIIAGKYLQ